MIIVWEQGANAQPSIYHGRGSVQNWAASVVIVVPDFVDGNLLIWKFSESGKRWQFEETGKRWEFTPP